MKCNRTLHDEFRHAVASTSEYCRVRQYSSVPAPSLRPRLATTHSVLIWRDFLFLFSVWWWRARAGFSKGEPDGILVPIRWTRFCQNYFSGDLDLAKPRLHFPPAERGLGNECGRGFGIRFRRFSKWRKKTKTKQTI